MPKLGTMMARAAAKSMLTHIDPSHIGFNHDGLITSDQCIAVANFNLAQQKLLIDEASAYLFINIDHDAFDRLIEKSQQKKADAELEDLYLLKGAPLTLMRRLFGMHANEFSRRRRLLNLHGSGNGRPPHIDEKTEHLVWQQWNDHKKDDERYIYLTIAENTGLDLHIIWALLRSFVEQNNAVT